ncbi:hypothetical protein Tco_1491462 [Tanacetum coccineum]
MIIYRIEEVRNKRKGPMPFAMLLTRLYNHILTTNPQAIIPIARFTFHEYVMDPLDISINPSKENGKKIASPLVISSSSSSTDDNEAPSFLEFYDELSDSTNIKEKDKNKDKTGQNRAWDRKEHEKTDPKIDPILEDILRRALSNASIPPGIVEADFDPNDDTSSDDDEFETANNPNPIPIMDSDSSDTSLSHSNNSLRQFESLAIKRKRQEVAYHYTA